MNKINWKEKLSSRKFWAMLAALIVAALVFFNVGENQIAQISSIIGAFGSIVVYMLAEASVDKSRNQNKEDMEEDNYGDD